MFGGITVAWSNLLATRNTAAESPVELQLVRTAMRPARLNDEIFWIDDLSSATLQDAGITSLQAAMTSRIGRLLRTIADRENWYLPAAESLNHTADGTRRVPATVRPGLYLKKHRIRNWATRLASLFNRPAPRSPGRVEAENALMLEGLNIPVMRVVGFGERMLKSGCQESFLISEELVGYQELQAFIQSRYAWETETSWLEPGLRKLIVKVADIARRFHAAGYNHRDFYCCHFLVRESASGEFDVRLIDLQRVQHRKSHRHRWIVKDLAQLASMSPNAIIGRRTRVLFLRHYFGVASLRTIDRKVLRDVLSKEAAIRREVKRKQARSRS